MNVAPVASFRNLNAFLSEPVEHIDIGSGLISAPTRTGNEMKNRVVSSGANVYVRKWAERIIERVEPRDQFGEVDAIFRFVQSKMRYAKDPRGVEFVQSPVTLLRQIEVGDTPSGDCDDMTTLGLSLLRSIGYPGIIRITGYAHNPPGVYSHVYGLVNVKGEWIPFDAVRRDQNLGWEAPRRVRRIDIPV